MISLRKLHLYVGFALVPLILVQAVTGLLLKLRLSNQLVHTLHTWFKYRFDFPAAAQTAGKALGIVIAAGLAFLAVSGGVLYSVMRVQQLRRRRRPAGR